MTSLNLNYLLKGLISKDSHTGDSGFNIQILRGTKFRPNHFHSWLLFSAVICCFREHSFSIPLLSGCPRLALSFLSLNSPNIFVTEKLKPGNRLNNSQRFSLPSTLIDFIFLHRTVPLQVISLGSLLQALVNKPTVLPQ